MDTKYYLEKINRELSNHHFDGKPRELYEPIRYILGLGGKRLRPLLTLYGCYLFSGGCKKALVPSLGVETFHNFTLVHDDIMDNAPLRRGKSTVHTKWNNDVGILSGDTMLFKAYEFLIRVDDSIVKKVINLFNACAIEVCEGQQYDMNFEQRDGVGESEYINMIRLKTAVLLGFSLQLGGLIGGADDENAELLRKFGENIGIGFQLKDDLLDVYGDHEKFGKQVGGDIIANKKTYLLIKALELGSEKQVEQLNELLHGNYEPEEKVRQVTHIYDEIGINEITHKKMNEYFDGAFRYLDQVDCDPNHREQLATFSEYLINRDH